MLERWRARRRLRGLERARRLAAEQHHHPVFQMLCRSPLPSPLDAIEQTPLLAIDLETTGLDPDDDVILSFGWVAIDAGAISLASATHHLCYDADHATPGGRVGASAAIHGITDDQLDGAAPLSAALEALAGAAQGRILIAHGATIERDFLDRASARLFNAPLPLAFIDTLEMERRFIDRQQPSYAQAGDMLRLDTARRRYGLPRYQQHQALTDALSCAELFLAQAERLRPARLCDFF